jgi:hypothetical protein
LARFIDTAIRFTVILQRGPASTRRPFIRGRSALAVWEPIDGERSVDEIRARTGLSTANVRRILRDLDDNHFIVVNGGQGRPTTHRRAAERRFAVWSGFYALRTGAGLELRRTSLELTAAPQASGRARGARPGRDADQGS